MKFFYKGNLEEKGGFHIGYVKDGKMYYCKPIHITKEGDKKIIFCVQKEYLFYGQPKPLPPDVEVILVGRRPTKN